MTAATERAEGQRMPLSAWSAIALSRMGSQGARRWYAGAAFGLLYQVIMVISVWSAAGSVASKTFVSVMLVFYYAGFLFLPPIYWTSNFRVRITVLGLYWAYSLLFIPIIGASALWLWVLVGAVVATLSEEVLVVVGVVTVLVAVPLIYGVATGFVDSIAISAPITFSVAAMMFGINRQIKSLRELREAQGEVARLAVVEERARFSRDMHDVIGHSLTVVTVKSELARRLISIDPGRAEDEIADIERLSRGALADLRAAVAGYRDMSLSTELAVAQASLAAAGIEAHLPASADVAAPDLKELFGWVLRESVTNIIRHSQARNCWVAITRTELTIDDDGRGLPVAESTGERPDGPVPAGSGLKGLGERAEAAGAVLTCSPSNRGGLALTVRRAA